jgi:M6 family metalloprotease-like protein
VLRKPALAVVVSALAMALALPPAPAPAASRPTFPALHATVQAAPAEVRPGEPVAVSGAIATIDTATGRRIRGVPATYRLRIEGPGGTPLADLGPFTAGPHGELAGRIPGDVTERVTETSTLAVRVVGARFGAAAAADAGAGEISVSVPPTLLELENRFVSSVGWVKPGESYPFRILVRNHTWSPRYRAVVRVRPVRGMRFVRAAPAGRAGTASIEGGEIVWRIGRVRPRSDAGPSVTSLIALGRASSLRRDPKISWRDLSTTATLTYLYGPRGISDRSHGPKVVPPGGAYETARYGDRPFPVVPVDYFDRAHESAHTAEGLATVINSEDVDGSTFNLYQEMSYGQLFPHATVPSAGIATASFDVEWKSDRYREGGFQFTQLAPAGTCRGATASDLIGSPAYEERIVDGWYRLPGTTDYYGDDRFGWALIGQVAANALLADIDGACGPAAKAVYDAAHIADPDIDYSDFDTDKDGVVDFFMLVFAGADGAGSSQTSVPPYDNIWPHSFSLEFAYSDPETGLAGYISDDQLRDLEDRPLYYTNASRTVMTRRRTAFPVYVRVGPYNVNPESAMEKASVISHEYGHSLGLPDFYSNSRSDYGDFNLMATDKSQNMDVFAKQELGWLIPRVLRRGEYTIQDWRDSKVNSHRIHWRTPGGTPYVLKGGNVRNGTAFAVKLPPRRLLDLEKIKQGASPSHVWWSTAGNNYGCPPSGGRNLDVYLPELEKLPAGTPVSLTFNHYWDVEWDFDYGFVLMTADNGQSYDSVASENGYTTDASFNPQSIPCQTLFGNGITGTSGSYEAGTETLDRTNGDYPDGPFLADQYDLSAYAGSPAVLRFAYSTDGGVARPGWFIDDVKVTATIDGQERVIYASNFERGRDEARLFNGGCKGTIATAAVCTKPWLYVQGDGGSPFDHAYYLEMRDRSGFDLDGQNQNDRDPIAFEPGLLLVYTDETHGYGNSGTDDPPAQTPIDAQPEPGNNSPDLNDATFTVDETFSDFGDGYTNSYQDDASDDGNWHFAYNCLALRVVRMSGTDLGPDVSTGNLIGDVRFRIGGGCAKWDYGYGLSVTAGAGRTAAFRPPQHRP